ncbi:MAG: DUF92 domain-containing protein [Methanobacteriota archaeon]|nr:MAG: DUF92 domain-containing protein [Euryarchaeota archaeon]
MVQRIGLWLGAVLTLICIAVAPYIQPAWLLSLLVIFFSLILYLIQGTKYVSIAIIVTAILYGIGAFPLFVFASTLAIVVAGELAYRTPIPRVNPYIAFLAASTLALLLVWLYLRTGQPLSSSVPLTGLMGIMVAGLIKSALQDREDTLMIEGLAVAMTMYLFSEINYAVDLVLLLIAVIVAFTFGYFAYRFRAADLSGLFSAALVGIILIVFTSDVRWFLIMLTFFILGSAATRFKYRYKVSKGIAQAHGGVRGYFNVFANGMVAIAAAVLFGITQSEAFIALFLGSVATAAADTVAGEIGMTASNPYLITTLEQVPPGTNGGVSPLGLAAGLVASFAVVAVAFLLQVSTLPLLVACTAAGFLGSQVDSYVGAVLENRGVIGNSGTNFIATLSGGILAMLFSLV